MYNLPCLPLIPPPLPSSGTTAAWVSSPLMQSAATSSRWGRLKRAQWGGGMEVMEVPPLLCAHTGLGLMPHSPSSPAPTNVSV